MDKWVFSTFEGYREEAVKTCVILGTYQSGMNDDILHQLLGIDSEIGELCDGLKKHIAYKKELDSVNMAEELGDICWYIANYSHFAGLDFYLEPNFAFVISNFEQCHDALKEVDVTRNTIPFILNVISALATFFDTNIETVLQNNVNKLRARYSEGKFSVLQSDERDTDIERGILSS